VAYVTDDFDDEVTRLLRQGGVGLLPSDTIYGLSAVAINNDAVEKLHSLKARSPSKPFIVLISDIKMLDLLSISPDQAELVKEFWPGPLSAILPSSAPDYLTRGTQSLAVRLPDYPELLKLINEVGPIISTSANLEGKAPAKNMAEAQVVFGDKLDFYVDIGELNNPPSTLAIIDDGKLKVVRTGAVKID
jgi:L-threonylcarbamoyladenylate synthase